MRALIPAVLILASALAGTAAAQGGPRGTSIAGAVGAGTTYDDEGQIGGGAQVGIRVDQRIAGKTFVEGSFDYLHHERSDAFQAEGKTLFFTGAVVQRFGTVHQPYVLGGITVARHDGTSAFPGLGPVSLHESTDVGFIFGGGVAFAIGDRFEAGPDARFVILQADDDGAPAYAYWIGGRFGIRF